MRTALITSTLQPRLRIGEIARATQRQLRGGRAAVCTVETDALPHSALMTGGQHPILRRAQDAVATAEALVVVTPRYEPSGSDPLRTLLADLPSSALRGKPVLPIGLGAIRSHATGLTRVARPDETATLPGCFLYDAWLEKRLDHWRLTPKAVHHLTRALRSLAVALTPEPERLAS